MCLCLLECMLPQHRQVSGTSSACSLMQVQSVGWDMSPVVEILCFAACQQPLLRSQHGLSLPIVGGMLVCNA